MIKIAIIRKSKGKYRLYSKKKNPKTGKRKLLGESTSLEGIRKREKEVQFFKHQADDYADDYDPIEDLSNTASYLEEAGYIAESDQLFDIINRMEPDDEDYTYDCYVNRTDRQNNNEGVGGESPSWGADAAIPTSASLQEKIITANKLDEEGKYEEADAIDAELIEEVEKLKPNKKPPKPKKVNVPGLVGLNTTTQETTPGSAGMSDAYLFRPSGTVEHNN
jgi:hypothetical protein